MRTHRPSWYPQACDGILDHDSGLSANPAEGYGASWAAHHLFLESSGSIWGDKYHSPLAIYFSWLLHPPSYLPQSSNKCANPPEAEVIQKQGCVKHQAGGRHPLGRPGLPCRLIIASFHTHRCRITDPRKPSAYRNVTYDLWL